MVEIEKCIPISSINTQILLYVLSIIQNCEMAQMDKEKNFTNI